MKRARTTAKASATRGRTSPAHGFFIYKIGILRRLLDRYSTPALTGQFDLTVAEWRVLTHLYASSPTTAGQICLRVQADKAEISRACAGLVARDLASRRRDAKDRRSVLLAITPRGERLHDAIIPLRQALQDDLESPLRPEEVAELHRLLDKLTDYVSQKMPRQPETQEAIKRQNPPPGSQAGQPGRRMARKDRNAVGSRRQ